MTWPAPDPWQIQVRRKVSRFALTARNGRGWSGSLVWGHILPDGMWTQMNLTESEALNDWWMWNRRDVRATLPRRQSDGPASG